MTRILHYILLLSSLFAIASCSELSHGDVEKILNEEMAYPAMVEIRIYTNDDQTAQEVIDKNLVKDGLVKAQIKHTREDYGKPLIYFTERAQPYLLATDDTLKSIDVQRVKVADEVIAHIRNVEVSPAGDKAVVDYTTVMANQTPFIVLYKSSIEGELKRRTFLTRKGDRWTWEGKIIKMAR